MIEDKDDRRFARDVFETRDLNALEVNPQRQPQERNYEVADHRKLATKRPKRNKISLMHFLCFCVHAIIPTLSQLIQKSIA